MSYIKNKKSIIAVLLAAVMLVGVFTFAVPVAAEDEVKVDASHLSYGDDNTTTFNSGASIYVKNNYRNSGYKDAATYTYNGTTWNMTDGTLVWNGAEQYSQFNAWYPAEVGKNYDNNTNQSSFTITDQTTAAAVAANDLMAASSEYALKKDELSLQFDHLLTKITVNIKKWGTEIFTAEQAITEAEVCTMTDITVSGTMHQYTLVYTFAAEGTGDASWIKACLTEDADDNKTSFTAIICPGTGSADENGYWLRVKVGTESDYRYVKLPNDLTLEAGKHYEFNLRVGHDLVLVNSVSVMPWNEKEITASNAEEVNLTYDETGFTVYNATGLTTALGQGGNITLGRSFDYTPTTGAAAFSVASGKSVVLDLNGHTLTSEGTTLYVAAGASVTLKDSATGGAINGKIAIKTDGTLIFESAIDLDGTDCELYINSPVTVACDLSEYTWTVKMDVYGQLATESEGGVMFEPVAYDSGYSVSSDRLSLTRVN